MVCGEVDNDQDHRQCGKKMLIFLFRGTTFFQAAIDLGSEEFLHWGINSWGISFNMIHTFEDAFSLGTQQTWKDSYIINLPCLLLFQWL